MPCRGLSDGNMKKQISISAVAAVPFGLLVLWCLWDSGGWLGIFFGALLMGIAIIAEKKIELVP